MGVGSSSNTVERPTSKEKAILAVTVVVVVFAMIGVVSTLRWCLKYGRGVVTQPEEEAVLNETAECQGLESAEN